MNRNFETCVQVLNIIKGVQDKNYGICAILTRDCLPEATHFVYYGLLKEGGFIAEVDLKEEVKGECVKLTWKAYAFLDTYEVYERYKSASPDSVETRMAYVALVSFC